MYPVTKRAEEDLRAFLEEFDEEATSVQVQQLVRIAVETIGEYEHGSADLPKGVDSVEQYSAAVVDFVETVVIASH